MKTKLFQLITLVLIASVALLTGCGSFGTTSSSAEVYFTNGGTFGENVFIPVKDFEAVGLVFTTTQFTTNDKTIDGDVFTYQALLKEAEKLGAHAIINIVIDKKFELVTTGANLSAKTWQQQTWYASALAIKYTETLRETGKSTVINENGTTVIEADEVFFNRAGASRSSGGGSSVSDTSSSSSSSSSGSSGGGLFGLFN